MTVRFTGLPKEYASVFTVICETCQTPELRLGNAGPVIADVNQKLKEPQAKELAWEHQDLHRYGPQQLHVPEPDIRVDGCNPQPPNFREDFFGAPYHNPADFGLVH